MNQRRIPESDLILNPDGSLYHINLRPEEVATTILAVGDPDRVPKVSQYFDAIEVKKAKREIVAHTGYLGSKRLTVISTGMGTDNVEIVLTELDALFNVNLETRTATETHTPLKIIRMGTSGSLLKEIPVDSVVLSHTGTGLDTLAGFYPVHQDTHIQERMKSFAAHVGLPFVPAQFLASSALLNQMKDIGIEGHTITCPGFYGPQGRAVRLFPFRNDLIATYRSFSHQGFSFTNFEMETSGYYLMAHLLGHEALSVNAIVANRELEVFSTQAEKTVEKMIKNVLERLQ
jgi:uridine phosphorylase